MRLPNLNWPANLYVDVMTPLTEFEMLAGSDDFRHAGVGEALESSASDTEFELFTFSGISPRPSMTASRP